MSFQAIRSYVETSVINAFSAAVPPVPVVFENVGSEPPSNEYAVLGIDYVSTTEPILSITENSIEVLQGNIQMAIYSPRGVGMKRLEELSTIGLVTLNKLKMNVFSVGKVLGPINVLSGSDPLALVNVSAPFKARIPQPAPVVTSVFGRVGDVVAQSGDYSINQLSDVRAFNPQTGQLMVWDGAEWKANGIDGGVYE